MAKKVKEASEIVNDIYTKVSNVFKKDLYIIDNQLIVAGGESDELLSGQILCKIHPLYINSIKEYLGEHHLIYIDDVKKHKKEGNGLFIEDENERKYTELLNYIKCIENEREQMTNWWTLGTLSQKEKDDFFEDYLDLKIENDLYINIGKPLLPLVTVKNMDTVMCGHRVMSDGLSSIIMILSHTYFDVLLSYKFAHVI